MNLLSEAELDAGMHVKLNTRGMLKGSSQERAAYYGTMRANGLMTINECRDEEDMDRINDPIADQITPAANLFGMPTPPPQPLTEIQKAK
jgi:phage portal protein BeeE